VGVVGDSLFWGFVGSQSLAATTQFRVRHMNTNAQTHSDLIWSIEFVPNWTGIAAIVIIAALIGVILRLRRRAKK
jgi:hypothetical protein